MRPYDLIYLQQCITIHSYLIIITHTLFLDTLHPILTFTEIIIFLIALMYTL